ncbi:MAG: hypothetical protein KatS3mg073_0744 [Meiothermus sp.]|nr:MAG: hypothetical protein KatS3mg073_0744 [Meiothermus sp.]
MALRVIFALALAIGIYLVWTLWPRSQSSTPVAAPAAVTIQEASPAQSASAEPMNRLALEEIRPEMVSFISQQNGRWVLNFQDGSKREVYPFEIELLPEQLQFQMNYKRGGS